MTVIDLIIKLQQLPPNMEVVLDLTRDEAIGFHFKEVVSVEKIGTPVTEGEMVMISPNEWVEDDE